MNDAVRDALRIAKRPVKPVRFHHTVARKGYAEGGDPHAEGEVTFAPPQAPAPVVQPDDAQQEAFLKEQLKGSAPQYDPAAGMHTAKEAGLMAAGMIPGTGLAAAAGKFPTAEGGFEPSLKEDIQKGEYLSAGLKGLGAAGDVLQAVPVVGTAAGAALKAPLAVKLATAMAPAARLAREAAPVAEAAQEAAPAARAIEASVEAAPALTKTQSQEAMKAAWEAGQGNTEKFKNWNHQWNVEEGPKFAKKQQAQEAVPVDTSTTQTFYHGSPHKFSAFDLSKSPEGIHLTSDEAIAREYAGKESPNVYKVEAKYDPQRMLSASELIERQPVFSQLHNAPIDVSQAYTGERFFQALSKQLGSPGAAAEYLKSAGVHGMSYPAAGHMAFYDPEMLKIIPEYKRLVNPAGFYSRAHEVAMNELPAEPRTWQEMYSLLSKAPRVVGEELYWSGLHPEAFAPGEKVSREQIAQLIEKNFPQVHPEIRAEVDTKNINELEEALRQAETQYSDLGDQYRDLRYQVGREGIPTVTELRDIVDTDPGRARELIEKLPDELKSLSHELIDKMESRVQVRRELESARDLYRERRSTVGMPKYMQHTVPGGTDYEERILKHQYNPQDQIHPDIEAKYKPESERIFKEMQQASGDIVAAERNYRNEVVKPFVDQMRQDYVELQKAERGTADQQKYGVEAALLDESTLASRLGKNDEFERIRMEPPEVSELKSKRDQLQKELDANTQKAREESREVSPAYTQERYTHTHWDNTENPVVHTRNSTRTGPEGEKIWHQEELQSDWAQQGREKGFKNPKDEMRAEAIDDQIKQLVDQRRATENKMRAEYEAQHKEAAPEYHKLISEAKRAFESSRKLQSDVDTYNKAYEDAWSKMTPEGDILESQFNQRMEELRNEIFEQTRTLKAEKDRLLLGGQIPSAPYTRDTAHWLELAAKDTLAQAIERGYDKIFITGGQEQAKRWSNELRKAIDNVRWESTKANVPLGEKELTELREKTAQERHGTSWESLSSGNKDRIDRELTSNYAPEGDSKTIYTTPTSATGLKHRFVVSPVEANGKTRYEVVDSSIPSAKGETLSSVIGSDLAKRIMAEDSGNVPMKGYRMGSEGYTQTYERKAPSIYKKLIRSLDPEAKVEAGALDTVDLEELKQRAFFEYGREWQELSKAEKDQLKAEYDPGVGGTYVQITPKMREEYNRLKQKFGSVFPAYKRGGKVVDALTRANLKTTNMGTSGEDVKNALRIAKRSSRKKYATDGGVKEQSGKPDEFAQEKFIKEQLEGSAPQYTPEEGLATALEYGRLLPGVGALKAFGLYPDGRGGYQPSLREEMETGQTADAVRDTLGIAVPVYGGVRRGLRFFDVKQKPKK